MDNNLNLKHYGWVNAEILWQMGGLFKIAFLHEGIRVVEIFNYSEILNGNEIFIDPRTGVVSKMP